MFLIDYCLSGYNVNPSLFRIKMPLEILSVSSSLREPSEVIFFFFEMVDFKFYKHHATNWVCTWLFYLVTDKLLQETVFPS